MCPAVVINYVPQLCSAVLSSWQALNKSRGQHCVYVLGSFMCQTNMYMFVCKSFSITKKTNSLDTCLKDHHELLAQLN